VCVPVNFKLDEPRQKQQQQDRHMRGRP